MKISKSSILTIILFAGVMLFVTIKSDFNAAPASIDVYSVQKDLVTNNWIISANVRDNTLNCASVNQGFICSNNDKSIIFSYGLLSAPKNEIATLSINGNQDIQCSLKSDTEYMCVGLTKL